MLHFFYRFAAVFSILLLSFSSNTRRLHVFMAGDSTMSVKETNSYPETGWGMPFVYFFDSSVSIINKAKNGRSTRTFITEGLWNAITDNIQPGDYVFIQFGHNDESKEKVDRYTTPEEFKANLVKFVTETREKKGIPILFTPVSRRKFDKAGVAQETHEMYAPVVRQVATELKVSLIDLDEKSKAFYQQLGDENSKTMFMYLEPGEHPNYPAGLQDNTHFNEVGARKIAQIVLKELQAQKIPLAEHLTAGRPKK